MGPLADEDVTAAAGAGEGSRRPRRPPLNPDLLAALDALPGIVLVTDARGAVLLASREATDLRLLRRDRLAAEELRECIRECVQQQRPVSREITWRRPPARRVVVDLRVRAVPLSEGRVLLSLIDMTEERRVMEVRRDFIANVSHELKTPVGAMSILAEALVAARDDPEAVEHFASRMQSEAARLASLVNDVIDLSRVQGDDPLTHAQVVDVDKLVAGGADFVRAAAEARDIEIVAGGTPGLLVYGDPDQLETALRNVLSNAVAYSEPGTRVAVGVRHSPPIVEIDVKDQGMGIAEIEQDRIFERFYRVDEARSRVTGGTGLGLSIVRNVCRNHGGDCQVWSVEGEGSTFTLQLPEHVPGEEEQ